MTWSSGVRQRIFLHTRCNFCSSMAVVTSQNFLLNSYFTRINPFDGGSPNHKAHNINADTGRREQTFVTQIWFASRTPLIAETSFAYSILYCSLSRFLVEPCLETSRSYLRPKPCILYHSRLYFQSHLSLHNLRNRNKNFWEELIAYFPWCDADYIENDASNNSSIVECVFVTAVTFLPSRCLATIWTIRRHTHRQQHDLMRLLYFSK
jgi:hypothetical protein